MNLKNFIINNYFEIIELNNKGFTYNEITKIINDKYNISINKKMMENIVYQIKNNKLLTKFNKSIYFIPDNDSSSNLFDISKIFNGIWVTLPTVNINKGFILTKDNIIKKTINPISRIYAKWLLREFDISNKYLLENLEVNETEKNKIQTIYLNIENEFDNMYKELKIKYLKHFFRDKD